MAASMRDLAAYRTSPYLTSGGEGQPSAYSSHTPRAVYRSQTLNPHLYSPTSWYTSPTEHRKSPMCVSAASLCVDSIFHRGLRHGRTYPSQSPHSWKNLLSLRYGIASVLGRRGACVLVTFTLLIRLSPRAPLVSSLSSLFSPQLITLIPSIRPHNSHLPRCFSASCGFFLSFLSTFPVSWLAQLLPFFHLAHQLAHSTTSQ